MMNKKPKPELKESKESKAPAKTHVENALGTLEQWKKIRDQIKRDRGIDAFPRAYLDEATPYDIADFSPKVKEFCAARKFGKVDRKEQDLDDELNIAKLVLVGDVSVGKTSMIHKYCHDLFNKDYKATIGVDFEIERFDVLNVPFTLQIWDTAGQERFKSIASSYYRGANVIVVVFDLNDPKTLDSCAKWLNDAIDGNSSSPWVFLVGTKKDLCSVESYRRMQSKAIALSKEMKAEFWPISSRTGENLHMLFCRITAMTFERFMSKEADAAKEDKPQIPEAKVIKLKRKKKRTPKEMAVRLLRRTKCWRVA